MITALLFVSAGCNPSGATGFSVRDNLARGEDSPPEVATTRPATTADSRGSGRPVARVNGVPIEQRELLKVLLETRGLILLQQLILSELARQECERLGVVVTAEDVKREYDLTLQADRFNGHDAEKLTPARREELIRNWLQTRGVSRKELAIAIRRQARLRKLVSGGITLTDEMLRREFARLHGEKVEVRHIQFPALRGWASIKQRLDQGEAFETLVTDYSQNRLSRERRGLLPPFSADDPDIPAALIDAAFALEPGQVSNPIHCEGAYHVLKLERRIPPDEVTFEEAQDKLRSVLNARLAARGMEELSNRLLMQSELRIEDRTLRGQYESRRAEGRIIGPALAGP